MEEKKKNIYFKNILIGILLFLLGASLFYIGYDKFFKKDKNLSNNEIKEDKIDEWFKNNQKLLDMVNIFSFKEFNEETSSVDDYVSFIITYMKENGNSEDGKDITGNLVSLSKKEVKETLDYFFDIDEEKINNIIDKLDNYKVKENDIDKDFYVKNNTYYLNYLTGEFDQGFYLVSKTSSLEKVELCILAANSLGLEGANTYNYSLEELVNGIEIITLKVKDGNYKIEKIKYIETNKQEEIKDETEEIKDMNNNQLSKEELEKIQELLKGNNSVLLYDNLGVMMYFEKILNDIIFPSDNNGKYVSYKVAELDDDYFSTFIWRKAGYPNTISNDAVKVLMKEYFNKVNYEVKELDLKDSLFGLKKTKDGYETSVRATDAFDFPLSYVKGLKYDEKTMTMNVYFDFYTTYMMRYSKLGSGTAIFKYQNNNDERPYFYLYEVSIDK